MSRPTLILFFVSCVHLSVTDLSAQNWRFKRILDSNDQIPNSTDTYTDFRFSQIDEHGNISFVASTSSGVSGVFYRNDRGIVSTIADENTMIPDRSSTFDTFFLRSMRNGRILFDAGNTQDSYISDGAGFSALNLPTINNGPGHVDVDRSITITGSEFNGFLYTELLTNRSGGFVTFADRNTPIPDKPGQTFNWYQEIVADNGNTPFIGWDKSGNTGVYAFDQNGSMFRIADETTSISGETGHQFDTVFAENENVLFEVRHGVHVWENGLIRTVVDENTPNPGIRDQFVNFDESTLSGGYTTFLAFDTNTSNRIVGIYSDYGDRLHAVIEETLFLDSMRIQDLQYWQGGFNDNQIVFEVEFDSGLTAIYLATIPEPGAISVALAIFSGLMLGSSRRSKGKR